MFVHLIYELVRHRENPIAGHESILLRLIELNLIS